MPRPSNDTKKEIHLGIKLNEELTARFRFFQHFYQQKYAKEALRLMIVNSTNALGYKSPKKED